MKIVISGAKGMLGNDLTSFFIDKGYKTYPLLRKEMDITIKDDIQRVLKAIKPDILINSSAYTNVDDCETNKKNAYDVNALGAQNLALSCKDHNVKLVHFSTDYVFDGTAKKPYMEDDLTSPANIYGKSKLEGEKLIKSIFDNFLIIRTSWLYGKNGKNFVDTIIKISKENNSIEVVNDQTGSPTFTFDLSSAVCDLLINNASGTVNVTNKGECTWFQFAKMILKLSNNSKTVINPVSTLKFNRPAKRPAYSVLNLHKHLSFTKKPMRLWETALEDYIMNKKNS